MEIGDLLSRYDVARRGSNSRPWLLTNFVTSIDGRVTVHGRVGPLTSPSDRRVFRYLRSVADIVLVGAATVRAERYGPIQIDEDERRQRRRRGQSDRPKLVIVSQSLDLDLRNIATGDQRVGVLTSTSSDHGRRAALAAVADIVVCGDLAVDLRAGLELLRRQGEAVVLCEGGPTLFDELVRLRLVDEICLTIAPIAGGDALPRHQGPPSALSNWELEHALVHDANLFLRWSCQSNGLDQ